MPRSGRLLRERCGMLATSQLPSRIHPRRAFGVEVSLTFESSKKRSPSLVSDSEAWAYKCEVGRAAFCTSSDIAARGSRYPISYRSVFGGVRSRYRIRSSEKNWREHHSRTRGIGRCERKRRVRCGDAGELERRSPNRDMPKARRIKPTACLPAARKSGSRRAG